MDGKTHYVLQSRKDKIKLDVGKKAFHKYRIQHFTSLQVTDPHTVNPSV